MTIPEELSILREQPLHKQAVVKLAYSPLGTKLASISQDTLISVIKTPMFQNQLEVSSLGGHNGPVNSIHFSANDQYLISASSDKSCIVWNQKWSKKGEKLLVLDRLKKNKTAAVSDPL
jgi:WD40 repeat protein